MQRKRTSSDGLKFEHLESCRVFSDLGARLANLKFFPTILGPCLVAISLSGCQSNPVTPPETTIGAATMLSDGTLSVQFRATADTGAIGDALIVLRPEDPRYKEFIEHIGDLKPGETKAVRPWVANR